MRILESHSAGTCKRGTLWDFQVFILFQNIEKLKGTLESHQKKFRKSLTVSKKIERVDPLVSFGFVCYVKKGKKGDPLP